jgi:hypothetical protein
MDKDDRMIVAAPRGQDVLDEQRVQHVEGAVVRALRRIRDELAAQVSELELARFAAGNGDGCQTQGDCRHTDAHQWISLLHSWLLRRTDRYVRPSNGCGSGAFC